ncbi:hypothetical protein NQ318_008837, partial [Aromia moschata]
MKNKILAICVLFELEICGFQFSVAYRVGFNAPKALRCDLNSSPSTPQKATPCRNLNSQDFDGNYLRHQDGLRRTLSGLRKVYPYYFTFTTFTKGRWVGERILDVFAREFRAHPAEEYERCIQAGTLTVNYEKVSTDYKLKHNDLLANIVH